MSSHQRAVLIMNESKKIYIECNYNITDIINSLSSLNAKLQAEKNQSYYSYIEDQIIFFQEELNKYNSEITELEEDNKNLNNELKQNVNTYLYDDSSTIRNIESTGKDIFSRTNKIKNIVNSLEFKINSIKYEGKLLQKRDEELKINMVQNLQSKLTSMKADTFVKDELQELSDLVSNKIVTDIDEIQSRVDRIYKIAENKLTEYLEKKDTEEKAHLLNLKLTLKLSMLNNSAVRNPKVREEFIAELNEYIKQAKLQNITKDIINQIQVNLEALDAKILKQQEEEAKIQLEINKSLEHMIKNIKNPALRNFIMDDVRALKNDVQNNTFIDLEHFEQEKDNILQNAKTKLEQWKKENQSVIKTNAIKDQIIQKKNALVETKIENQNAKSNIIKQLDDLFSKVESGEISDDKIESYITESKKISDKVTATLIDEEVHKEMTRNVISTLTKQGFITEQLDEIVEGDKKYFKIIARMPNGEQASCNLFNDGSIHYDFDNFKGMTCLENIKKFSQDLDSIYGVKIEDAREIWRNPDEIGKDALDLPGENQINR